ncbi:MAG: hypothetical protein ABJN26_15890 [Stappiaceae bacterium]
MNQNKITFSNPEIDLELDFSIQDYQFPDLTSGCDDNWLIVKLKCRYQGRVFEKKDPSITSHELESIRKWFQSIAGNTIPEYTCLSFTEPNLEFELFGNRNGTVRFGIKLAAEFKPPFVIRQFAFEPLDPDDEFVLVFENSFEEMSAYAVRFQNMLEAFPLRC